MIKQMDTEKIEAIIKKRGIKLLFDTDPEDLRHEFRQLTHPSKPDGDSYYNKPKLVGHPHYTDVYDPPSHFDDAEVTITITEPGREGSNKRVCTRLFRI